MQKNKAETLEGGNLLRALVGQQTISPALSLRADLSDKMDPNTSPRENFTELGARVLSSFSSARGTAG